MYGYDFDEDLSELEEGNKQQDDAEQVKEEGGQECECGGGDPECDCMLDDDDDDTDDDESERSYDGSDADHYCGMKAEREERKLYKLEEREKKNGLEELERTKEEEVRVAYTSLRKVEKEHRALPDGSFAGQSFRLFCSDHVKHFYDADLSGTKRVDFYYLDDIYPNEKKFAGETGMLRGDMCLDMLAYCDFGPFRPPKRASRKAVKVKSSDGKYELSFVFISNRYLKLKVSREMVSMKRDAASPAAPLATAPEVFEFVGICRDREKEKAERQKRMEQM